MKYADVAPKRNIIKTVIGFIIYFTCCLPLASQTKRALVVGISEYQSAKDGAWSSIHGANDADLITTILKAQGFKTKKICNKAATAREIRKRLNSLISSSKQGDIIYLHFSCHGQPFEDVDGDEEDGWDESIVPFDALMKYNKGSYEGENHITDDELYVSFQKLRKAVGTKGFIYVVIDACHAGGTSRGEEDDEDEEPVCRGTKQGFGPIGKPYNPRINTKGHFIIEQSGNQSGIIILEACRSYQSNYEIKQDGKYYGPLSYYIYQVLKKQPLISNLTWVNNVKKLMDADKRLIRQNMVYETSLK